MIGHSLSWLPLITVIVVVFGQECSTDGTKCDTHERCAEWRREGECVKSRGYMLEHCPASCAAEDLATNFDPSYNDACVDKHELCSVWASQGDCDDDKYEMNWHCAKSCRTECQLSSENPRRKAANSNHAYDNDDYLDEIDMYNHDEDFEMEDFENEVIDDSTEDDNDDYPSNYDNIEDVDLEDDCTNNHEHCEFWAKTGECDKNPRYMKVECAKACNVCNTVNSGKLDEADDDNDEDNNDEDDENNEDDVIIEDDDDDDDEINDNTRYQALSIASKQYGKKQAIEGPQSEEVAQLIQKSIHYMEEPQTQNLPEKVLKACRNRNKLCAFWAVIGECDKNPAYMITTCAPSCMTCNMIDIKNRCPLTDDLIPALQPGDLNKMFERIVQTAPGNRSWEYGDDIITEDERRDLEELQTPNYTVHVLSRPPPVHANEHSDTDTTNVSIELDQLVPPWVITFEDFLTEEECDTLIQLGHKYEYKRSEDVGAERFDGTFDGVQSQDRTSYNAWCSSSTDSKDLENSETSVGCRQQLVPNRVHERIARVLQIPATNSEDFQMLKYEVGQFYRTHHDFIEHQVQLPSGPRILTFFLYLNDVEEGGGTNFPPLDLTVQPKRGRALLWPSVYNADPLTFDPRTHHQALPVIKGRKYAANGWIHLYDFVTANNRGCA